MKYRGSTPKLLREYAKKHEFFSGSVTDVSKVLKISRETVYEWMKEHPEFKMVIDEIQNEVDDRVENALLKSALGYTYRETKVVKAGTEEDARVLQVIIIEKHQPGSITSQKFWLENRRGGIWKEKQEVEQTGNLTVVFEEGDDKYL